MADQSRLLHYVQRFAHLRRGPHSSARLAPHKPILLLAILDMVEHDLLQENLVRITPELVCAFRTQWVAAWQERRNTSAAKIDWRFTTEEAHVKLKKLYPTVLPG